MPANVARVLRPHGRAANAPRDRRRQALPGLPVRRDRPAQRRRARAVLLDQEQRAHRRYDSLEENTDSREHVLVLGASYSTLPAYLRRKFPLPMTISVGYRDRFAGAGPGSGQVNPVLRTRWLVFGLAVMW